MTTLTTALEIYELLPNTEDKIVHLEFMVPSPNPELSTKAKLTVYFPDKNRKNYRIRVIEDENGCSHYNLPLYIDVIDMIFSENTNNDAKKHRITCSYDSSSTVENQLIITITILDWAT